MSNLLERILAAGNIDFESKYLYDPTDKVIGEGGFGVVYKCTCKSSGTAYAVKALDRIRIRRQGEDLEEKILQEVENMQRLDSHRNIVHYIGHYVNDHGILIIMELVKGESLNAILDENEFVLTEVHAKCMFYQVASAIEFMHVQHHTIHRDIKPDNIIVSDPPTGLMVKLIDFGLAKVMEVNSLSLNMTLEAGTAIYRAPEVMNNSHYDFKIDCWSLGVVLYQMLIFQTPEMESNDSNNSSSNNAVLPPTSPSALSRWQRISDESRDLIRSLLQINPNNRLSISEIMNHRWLLNNINHAIRLPYLIQSDGMKDDSKFIKGKTGENGGISPVLYIPKAGYAKYQLTECISQGESRMNMDLSCKKRKQGDNTIYLSSYTKVRPKTSSSVAVKFFDPSKSNHYHNELSILQSIMNSKNNTAKESIVPLLESCGKYFANIVEFVPNSLDLEEIQLNMLFEEVDNGNGIFLDDDDLEDVFKQVVSAVHCLHTQLNIAHRDISPANILIQKLLPNDNAFIHKPNFRVKITDFEYAVETEQYNSLIINDLIKLYSMKTLIYMAPEVINPPRHELFYNPFAGDIWSLGILLLQLYAKEEPFTTIADIRYLQVCRGDYHKYDIPDHSIRVLEAMLQLTPSDRVDINMLQIVMDDCWDLHTGISSLSVDDTNNTTPHNQQIHI
eukprot:gene6785-9294_t